MLPDKNKIVRNANRLLVVFAVSPWVFITVAFLVTHGNQGIARNPDIVPPVFLGLLAFSIGDVGLLAYIQTSAKFLADRARANPIGRAYLVFTTGAVLSEAHTIYGLVITLLSGSLIYVAGFSLVNWACLVWVRGRFKRNLGNIPSA